MLEASWLDSAHKNGFEPSGVFVYPLYHPEFDFIWNRTEIYQLKYIHYGKFSSGYIINLILERR